jgi:aldehyde dehydrogenase (NAD+)
MISRAQRDKAENYCQIAIQQGAEPVVGGRRVSDLPGYYLEPTIFTGVHAEHRINAEEVFGPVLTVMPFEDAEDAIGIANGVDYGLAAGVYTSDLSRAHRVASRLQSGTVFINGWYMGGMEVPFGGFKRSGYGRAKSLEGTNRQTAPFVYGAA